MGSGVDGVTRYVDGKCDYVYEIGKYRFKNAETYELTEEQYEKIRKNLGLGEKTQTAGASPEYNFAICDKYCKYYNFWACGQIKQWELEEICDKCEIFPKNP